MYELCLPHLMFFLLIIARTCIGEKIIIKKKLRDLLASKVDVSIPGTMQLVTSRLTRRRNPCQSARNRKKKNRKCRAVFRDRQKQ